MDMDIERMHNMIEKLTECAKHEFDKGIENIDTEEMSEVVDMIKDLSEAMYHRTITVAMEDSEYGVDYDWEGRKGYRGQMRDSKGRYTSRRRSYMPMMRDYDWDNMQMDRDMDREHGKMYYTEPMTMRNDNQTHSESRYDRARRGYEESKAMHKSGSVEDKKKNMESLEHYMKELSEEMAELIESMDASEKTMVRSKLQTLAQKVQ
jgi:hypothetical protein